MSGLAPWLGVGLRWGVVCGAEPPGGARSPLGQFGPALPSGEAAVPSLFFRRACARRAFGRSAAPPRRSERRRAAPCFPRWQGGLSPRVPLFFASFSSVRSTGGVPRFRRTSEGLCALRLGAERGASAVAGGGPCAHFEGQRRRAFGRSAAPRPLCCPPLFSGGLSSFSRLFVGGGVLAFLFVLRWPLRPRAPAMAAPRAPVPVSRARAS